MSKYEDTRSLLKDEERQPVLNSTDWKTSQSSVKAPKVTGDVSPRSKGEIPLSSMQTEEIRRRLEEVKERAKASLVAEAPSASKPAQSSTTAQSRSDPQPPPNLNPVSPELLQELRKIIREEVEELNKGEIPECGKSSRPLGPSPTTRSQSSPQIPALHTSSRDIDGNRATTATVSSIDTSQPKEPSKHATVRFSDETKPAVPVMPRGSVDDSKKASANKSTDVELTAIDQRWGLLFEDNATPTRRIEHILQGLATYIIDEFIPQGSIVVTPEKMAAFYSHHRLDKEVFPLATLFRSRPNNLNEALAGLYQDLGCQYFLVPPDSRSRPTVPGLTPTGFAHWLVTMIQAYPDEEAKRLGKIVSALPIEADSLLDGKPERLPKQISRYLLPEKPLRKSQKLVDEAMRDFMEDVNNTPTSSRSKAAGSGNGGSSSKSTPTAAVMERRSSTNTSSGPGSRHTQEALIEKNRADEGGSSHDRDRRAISMSTSSSRDPRDHDSSRRDAIPPPPGPGHLGRAYSLDNNGRSIRAPPHASSSSATGGSSRLSNPATPSPSSSSRKNRSPQRKPHSQSVPSGLDRDDLGAGLDRIRSSATLSAVAATVAAVVLGSSSSSSSAAPAAAFSSSSSAAAPSNSSSDASTRGGGGSSRAGGGGDFVLHREKRASLDESTPRTTPPPPPPSSSWNLRDKAGGLESGSSSSGSRSGRKRSVVVPDAKGPVWDDYVKSYAPRSSTSAFGKRE
ncbi:hypothetical protein VPNG_04646 [Cytospora leucostoma]|uniref:DUF7514 domain-containing protein n=1 Tax=Cytospora leucostoma TaxID=1230097 RepID=A0A423XAI9_9PEZI|nr:hypothetical protein VPNG_04646 [Cytospora leucostoma]